MYVYISPLYFPSFREIFSPINFHGHDNHFILFVKFRVKFEIEGD